MKLAFAVPLVCGVASAAFSQSDIGMTERMTVAVNTRATGTAGSVSISGNGRFVAFSTTSRNLIAEDSKGIAQVYVRDRILGTTELISVAPANKCGNGASGSCSISRDGRYVAFASEATNLVTGVPATAQIYVRDRTAKTTIVASRAAGAFANQPAEKCTISADGRFVAFESTADNLVADDTNSGNDVFVTELATGNVIRASLYSGNWQAPFGIASDSGRSYSISGDGRFVAFETRLAGLSGTVLRSIWIRDLSTGVTELAMTPGQNVGSPRLSGDGRFLAYQAFDILSQASIGLLYVLDRTSGEATLVSKADDGTVANASCDSPEISWDGGTVSFTSAASNLIASDTNNAADVFVAGAGVMRRVSVTDAGAQVDGDSIASAVSQDGTYVAFTSKAPVLTGKPLGLAQPYARVRDISFTLGSTETVGGGIVAGSIVLAKPAPEGGIRFNMSGSSTAAAVPGAVTVKAGQTSVQFSIKTSPVGANQTVRITLSKGDPIASRWLTIKPVGVP